MRRKSFIEMTGAFVFMVFGFSAAAQISFAGLFTVLECWRFPYSCKDFTSAGLENIKWISGTWHGEAFGGITEEIWSEPSGGSMMATFKLVADGKVQFYEIEVIREIENRIANNNQLK